MPFDTTLNPLGREQVGPNVPFAPPTPSTPSPGPVTSSPAPAPAQSGRYEDWVDAFGPKNGAPPWVIQQWFTSHSGSGGGTGATPSTGTTPQNPVGRGASASNPIGVSGSGSLPIGGGGNDDFLPADLVNRIHDGTATPEELAMFGRMNGTSMFGSLGNVSDPNGENLGAEDGSNTNRYAPLDPRVWDLATRTLRPEIAAKFIRNGVQYVPMNLTHGVLDQGKVIYDPELGLITPLDNNRNPPSGGYSDVIGWVMMAAAAAAVAGAGAGVAGAADGAGAGAAAGDAALAGGGDAFAGGGLAGEGYGGATAAGAGADAATVADGLMRQLGGPSWLSGRNILGVASVLNALAGGRGGRGGSSAAPRTDLGTQPGTADIARHAQDIIRNNGQPTSDQRTTIDRTIDQRVAEGMEAIKQRAINSGMGADSLITTQQLNKFKNETETIRQQLYMQQAQQNISNAIKEWGMANAQDLAIQKLVLDWQLANDKESQQAAMDISRALAWLATITG